MKNGTKYEAFLKPTVSRKGIANVVPCAVTGRGHVHLSLLERAVHYWLHFYPGVIDWREQYPFFDKQLIAAYLAAGKRIPRNKVPTFDIVYTKAATKTEPLRYGVISVKTKEELQNAEVWRRLQRERLFCEKNGWSHRMMTEKEISYETGASCREIALWCRHSNLSDDMRAARDVADFVRRHANGELSLDGILRSASDYLRCDLTDAYRNFSVACISKFIAIDVSKKVNVHAPLIIQ